MERKISHFIVFLAVLFLINCGGDGSSSGGSSGTISISAKVGSGYTVAYHPGLFDQVVAAILGKSALALGSGTSINQVVAVSSTQGQFGGDMLQNMKTANINSDGSFSITLEQSYDWVLLLVNSQATSLSEKVVSYVAVKVDDSNSLIAYSGDSLKNDIDLGELIKVGTEAQGTVTSASSFGLTLDQLKAVARSDNGFKHLINAYLNYNASTGTHYAAQPIFSWSAGAISGLDTIQTESAINSYVMNGFNLNVETNNVTNQALPDAVCSGNSVVTLFPPEKLQILPMPSSARSTG